MAKNTITSKKEKEFDVYKWHKENFPEDHPSMIYERATEAIAEQNKKRNEEHFKETGVRRFQQIRSARLRQQQDGMLHIAKGHKLIMQDLNGDKIFDIKVCEDCNEVILPINSN
jgi:hypothetical protein